MTIAQDFSPADGQTQFFTTVVFERPGKVGMNWYLTEADKEAILAGFQDKKFPNSANLRLLKDWWSKDWRPVSEKSPR